MSSTINNPSKSSSSAAPSATSSQTSSPAIKSSSAWAKGPPAVAAASSSSTTSQAPPSTPPLPSSSSSTAGSNAGPTVNGNGANNSTSNTIGNKDVGVNGTSKGGAQSSSVGGVGNGNGKNGEGSGMSNGTGGTGANGSASRKGTIFGVGGGTESKGVPIPSKAIPNHAASNSIAFGTTSSPNATLSSSPAAHPMTGSHLSDNIKTFGSVDASESSGSGNALVTSRKVSGSGVAPSSSGSGTTTAPSVATAAPKKFDVNKLFQGGGGAAGAGASSSPSPSVSQAAPSSTGSSMGNSPAGIPARPSLPTGPNSSGLPNATTPMRQQHQQQGGNPYAEAQAAAAQNPNRGIVGLPQAVGYDQQGRPVPYAQQQQHQQPQMNSFGMNQYPHQGQVNPGAGGFRPPPSQGQNLGGMRSPQMNHAQPHSPYNPAAAQFRPPNPNHQQQQHQQGNPGVGARNQGGMMSPRIGQQNQSFVVRPQNQMQGQYGQMNPYGQQGGFAYGQYAPAFYGQQQENPYGMNPQQWAQQQQGQQQFGQGPISPRPGSASIASASPAISHAGLPPNPSLATNSPSVSTRPPSIGALGHSNSGFSAASSQSSLPTTPSVTPARPTTYGPGVTFTPQSQQTPTFSAATPSFVPRAKSVIKITRADGTDVDLSQVAKASAPASPAKPAEPASTTPSTSSPVPPKPVFAPVVIRMETEAQKAAREAEMAKEKKIRDEEAREDKERKEREKARKAREEKEKAEKAEKAKAEAEEKEKVEKEKIAAKEKADAEAAETKRKADEEEAAANKKAEEEAAAKKAAEEKEAEQRKSERETAEAATTKSAVESDEKSGKDALPAKPVASEKEVETPSKPSVADTSSAAPSASPSPMGSPAMAAAGLPAKPVTTATALLERKKPSAPGLERSPSVGPGSPSTQSHVASAQAIDAARPISNLSAVIYPADMQGPDPSLNRDATSGKYRYDRNFLLQFTMICLERPVHMQNPENVGMFPGEGSGSNEGFNRSQSGRGGARSGSSRGGSSMPSGITGLGLPPLGGMGGFGNKASAGGSGSFGMGMGNFGGNTRGTSSEERLARSTGGGLAAARSSSGMMARTPSQGGPGGAVMPPSGLRDGSGLRERESTRIRSQRGTQRGQRDQKQGSMSNIFAPAGLEPGVAPLEMSANRWTPAVQNRRPGAIDESSPEYVERKVKGLLNKLTEEKFESISTQILEWANRSTKENDGMTLRLVIKLIFEKAKDEQFWSRMYARLCRTLLEKLSLDVKDDQLTVNDPKLVGGMLFRKYLLNRCQEDFERGWKAKEDSSAAAKEKAADDQAKKAQHEEAMASGKAVEEFKFSDEYYAEAAAKRQGLGLVKFVGELFKLDMLSAKIITTCVNKLLVNVKDPDEEDVESLCQLLTTVGDRLERHSAQMKGLVTVYMTRLQELKGSEHIASRLKFMVQDVIELQKHHWQARANQRESGPMTIDEVHQQAARDAQEASRNAAANQAAARNDAMSRGGSRRGEQRGGNGPPGASDQWQAVAARLPAKPSDMSSFGKITKSSGPTTFGPQMSVFGNKNKRAGDSATPPLSRTASSSNISANPFGVLDTTGEVDPSSGASPASESRERPKLMLAKRTKPVEGEEGSTTPGAEDEDEVEAGEGETDSTNPAAGAEAEAGGLSKSEIERKIKADRAEFWGEKDIGGTRNPEDMVEYFEGLPEDSESRGLLAKAFVEDVFRINKKADTEVVIDGFERAVEKGILTAEIAKQGLASSIEMLDDAAIDIPLAYTMAAQLIVACNLPQETIDELADSIEVLGDPIKPPKGKLLAEVEKLSGAAA